MRSRFRIVSLVLTAACVAPVAASAADAVVGGKGPRIRVHDRPPVMASGRPVFVMVDELAQFGDLVDVATAPPLVIRVEGDVDIFQLPDGTLRIVLDGDHEGEGE
jgi:hypothetical protein